MRLCALQYPATSCQTVQENGSSPFSCGIPYAVPAHLSCLTHLAHSSIQVPGSMESTAPKRSSPLVNGYTAPAELSSERAPAEEAPPSPKAPSSSASLPAPWSPGKAEVNGYLSMVKQLAQGCGGPEEEAGRSRRRQGQLRAVQHYRVVDAVQRTIEKRGVTPKQLARAEKSLDRQMCARAEAEKALLRAECLWYASRLDLEMAKVKRGEAKLASVKCCLRRRKVCRLMRWV